MGLLAKIVTAVRGGAREVGEAIVDANHARIFEQEIVDAEESLRQARENLTAVMAQEMHSSREIARLKQEITEHEGYATQALAKGNESLALEVAQKIAEMSAQLADQQKSLSVFQANSTRLKEMIGQSEHSLNDLKQQLVMVKTTESVQQATAAMADNFSVSSSKLATARESLERIRQRQQERDDRMKAGDMLQAELSGSDLQAKLQAAGIGPSANAAQEILDRLKAKGQQ